jgi:hypothetical protein
MDIRSALRAHQQRLAQLDLMPRPYTWSVSGSIEHHTDAIRILTDMIRREDDADLKEKKRKA